jgi:hypothetical protein
LNLTLESDYPEKPEALTSTDFDPSVEAWIDAKCTAEDRNKVRLIAGLDHAASWPSIAKLWLKTRRRETAPLAPGFRDGARRGWTDIHGRMRSLDPRRSG